MFTLSQGQILSDEEELEEGIPDDDTPPPLNPVNTGYPAGLALELALKIAKPSKVLETYGINRPEWDRIRAIPAFQLEFRELSEKAKEKGFSYQMKAAAQSEALLQTTWDLIQDRGTPASVRADMIKFTARTAGYDQKDVKGLLGEEGTDKINITINLGEQDVKRISGAITVDNDGPDDNADDKRIDVGLDDAKGGGSPPDSNPKTITIDATSDGNGQT